MRTFVVGTTGQLATELRRRVPRSVQLLEPEKVDLASRESCHRVLERLRPTLVINAGAYTAVDRAETERDAATAVNAAGPEALARWCAAANAALIHVSTDYVFDGTKPTPYSPDDLPHPINVYGETKLAGEERVRDALSRHVILRTSWVFSAHGNNFVKTMLRLAKERDELRVVSDQIGRPTFAGDLASGIWSVACQVQRGDQGSWGTYHFASAGETSWYGLARAAVEEQSTLIGRAPRVTAIGTRDYPTPARRPANSRLDTSSFERVFGLTPPHFGVGLRAVVEEVSRAL